MDSISAEYGLDQAATGSAGGEPVVSVRGLVKRYGSHEAVAGIDLEMRRGETFAFLGPNGAGKTTTVEILEGFQQRPEGQVSVLGHDPAAAGGAWRDRVGVVLQESQPEPGLSVRECLAMYAGFYRAPRDIDETIALAGLTGQAGKLGTRLSGGQRRRLDFALALIGDPELIFLDEPTTERKGRRARLRPRRGPRLLEPAMGADRPACRACRVDRPIWGPRPRRSAPDRAGPGRRCPIRGHRLPYLRVPRRPHRAHGYQRTRAVTGLTDAGAGSAPRSRPLEGGLP